MLLGPKNAIFVGILSPLKTNSAFKFESLIVGPEACDLQLIQKQH